MWCILSCTTAILHIVRREQTRKNVWCNVNSTKNCKKTVALSFFSIQQKILVNVLERSWKCLELKCLIKNWRIAKKFLLFGNIQHQICGKRSYINFWSKAPSFPKKIVKWCTKTFTVSLENTYCFFWKYCRIRKY